MSIYIGRTLSGPCLHITNGDEAIEQLAGSPIPTTIFHSGMPFVTYTHHNCSTVNNNLIPNTVKIVPDDISLILSGKPFLLLLHNSNGNIYTPEYHIEYVKEGQMFFVFKATILWTNYHNNDITLSASVDYPYPVISLPAGTIKVSLLIFADRFDNITLANPSNIVIDSSGVYVDSINVSRLQYLSTSVINNVDPVVSLGARSFQLINYVNRPSGAEFKKEGAFAYSILFGGVPTFSGLYSSGRSLVRTGTSYVVYSSSYSYAASNTYEFVMFPSCSVGTVCAVKADASSGHIPIPTTFLTFTGEAFTLIGVESVGYESSGIIAETSMYVGFKSNGDFIVRAITTAEPSQAINYLPDMVLYACRFY